MLASLADNWCIEFFSSNDKCGDRHRWIASAKRSVDWSELDSNLLCLILGLLGPLDHLRFSCVCRSWRRTWLALRNSPHMHAHLHQAYQAPMLLFCDSRSQNLISRYGQFQSPLDGRTYIFNLTDLFNHLCIGSSGSWLVTARRVPPHPFMLNPCRLKQELYLYNPFSATKFRLPCDPEINFEQVSQIVVSSLSEPPSSSSLWRQGLHFGAVLIVDQYSRKLYWIRGANATQWSLYECGDDTLDDGFVQLVAISCSKFYALTEHGRLALIDLDNDPVLLWGADGMAIHFDRSREDVYLVESDGELLAAIVGCPRGSSRLHQAGPSLTFRVLRLDSMRCEWIEANDTVKDKVLFLGKRGSMCRKVATIGGGRGKVYTTGADSISFGVFDMETCTGSVVRSDYFGVCPCWGVWVLPEFIHGDRETSMWIPVRYMLLVLATIFVHLLLVCGSIDGILWLCGMF